MLDTVDLKDFIHKAYQLLQTLNLADLETQLTKLQDQLDEPGVWDDAQNAAKINKEYSNVSKKIVAIKTFQEVLDNLQVASELQDEEQIEYLGNQALTQYEELQKHRFLQGKFDAQGALLSVHAGAGGVDAQDWASMLAQMYESFVTAQKWDWKVVALSAGEEAGIKSITLDIDGDYVYGLLKEEAGVHRLVRLSPFNAGKTRETSFALVEVLPKDVESEIQIADIPEKDLKWEYSMSSGKGGQSVNTTYSAVRVVHLPTNIAVTCQNERSQLQNKQMALHYLKNKLAVLEAMKQQELKKELKGGVVSAEWGNQIRSYVLHPYKLVKDHRSGYEVQDVDKVLQEGDILPFIWEQKRTETNV